MYGSFTSGEADAHSDVEFWLFFEARRRGRSTRGHGATRSHRCFTMSRASSGLTWCSRG
jgi:hypothetical protein